MSPSLVATLIALIPYQPGVDGGAEPQRCCWRRVARSSAGLEQGDQKRVERIASGRNCWMTKLPG